MSTLNAIGFVICGIAMAMLPFVAPHYFPAGTMPGGTSTMWVEFMGWVNGLIGSTFLVVERGFAFVRQSIALSATSAQAAIEEAKLLRPSLPADLSARPLSQRAAA